MPIGARTSLAKELHSYNMHTTCIIMSSSAQLYILTVDADC